MKRLGRQLHEARGSGDSGQIVSFAVCCLESFFGMVCVVEDVVVVTRLFCDRWSRVSVM